MKYNGQSGFALVLAMLAILAVICGIGALFYFAINASIARGEWLKANCQVIGRVSGSMITTISSDGKLGFGNTSSKTGYKCNDGMEYWE